MGCADRLRRGRRAGGRPEGTRGAGAGRAAADGRAEAVARIAMAVGGRVRQGRQPEAEGASLPELALHRDLAVELGGDLAADGQPQPGAAVAAAGGAISLLEGGEDA